MEVSYEDFKKLELRVAEVENVIPHPNADRLQICLVDTGNSDVQVVCGAPNARVGMKGVFAPSGDGMKMILVKRMGFSVDGQDLRRLRLRERRFYRREISLSREYSKRLGFRSKSSKGQHLGDG